MLNKYDDDVDDDDDDDDDDVQWKCVSLAPNTCNATTLAYLYLVVRRQLGLKIFHKHLIINENIKL